MARTVELALPVFHEGQWRLWNSDARFIVGVFGRRWEKTQSELSRPCTLLYEVATPT